METKQTKQLMPASLSFQEVQVLEDVLNAVQQQRSSLMHLSGLMGEAVGGALQYGTRGLSMVPKLQENLDAIANKALNKAFELSMLGLNARNNKNDKRSDSDLSFRIRKASVAISGVLGGFSGALGIVPDIGYTTLAIMREIASIAQEEGEDLSDPQTRLACLEIFGFNVFSQDRDKDAELGFFSARTFLRGQSMMMLMGDIASHYGFSLGRKLTLRMMPVAGALFGASLNTAFFNHYRAVARVRFTVRRLQREHGPVVYDMVKQIYKKM